MLLMVLGVLAGAPAQLRAGERALQADEHGARADEDGAMAARPTDPPSASARNAPRQADDKPCAGSGASQAPVKARPNDWQRRHRASRILGTPLCHPAGQKLGMVQDIVIDRQGRIAYGVIAVGGVADAGGKLFLVPWRELRTHAAYDQFVLDISPDRLLQAPAFDADDWPDITDKRWVREVNRFFAQRNSSPRAIKRDPVTERPAGSSQWLSPLETGRLPCAMTQRARATPTSLQPNRQESEA